MTYRTTLNDVWSAQHQLSRTLGTAGLLNHPTYGQIRTHYKEGRPRWGESFSLTFSRAMTEAEVAAAPKASDGMVAGNYNYTVGGTYTNRTYTYWVPIAGAEIHPALAKVADLTESRGDARRLLVAARQKIEDVTTAKTEGALEALNTVAGLLLDQVGLVTYQTMVADGMDRAEALRTAILLGRMEG